MRAATSLILSFAIAVLSVITAAGAAAWASGEQNEGSPWLFIIAGVTIPGASFYLLHARSWSEWLFQWFFWLGCLCLAWACVGAWSEFRSELWWDHSRSVWVTLQRVLFIFTGAVTGLTFLGIALIQDHLRPLCRRSQWPNKAIQRIGSADTSAAADPQMDLIVTTMRR